MVAEVTIYRTASYHRRCFESLGVCERRLFADHRYAHFMAAAEDRRQAPGTPVHSDDPRNRLSIHSVIGCALLTGADRARGSACLDLTRSSSSLSSAITRSNGGALPLRDRRLWKFTPDRGLLMQDQPCLESRCGENAIRPGEPIGCKLGEREQLALELRTTRFALEGWHGFDTVGSLAGEANCASGVCKIHLVPQPPHPREGSRRVSIAPAADH